VAQSEVGLANMGVNLRESIILLSFAHPHHDSTTHCGAETRWSSLKERLLQP
jgi:hypothetical protein